MRTKKYNWSTRCSYYPATTSDTFSSDFTICFYLTYFNIEDRFSCRREVSDFVCRNMNGCFAEGTKILMADGTQKSIQDIRKGDMVYNPATKKPSKVHKTIVGEETKPMFNISFDSDSVKATGNHPFITKNGIKTAEQLVVGDLVADKDFKYNPIIKIETSPSPKGTLVWNLLVNQADGEGTIEFSEHTFVANNLASGDYFVQQGSQFMKKEYKDFSDFLASKQH